MNNKKKILLTEEILPPGLDLLRHRDDVELIVAENTDEQTLIDLAEDVHAIAVRMAKITAPLINAAPQLEIVSRHGVGCDNIDIDAMNARGLPVAIGAGANDKSVAESALMLMLATSRRLIEQDKALREGRYAERNALSGNDCFGRHVLVIGFGRTGKSTARVCKGIGMNVTVSDIALDSKAVEALGVDAVSDWRKILPTVDFVTVHVPLTNQTKHMIAEKELADLPQGAIVINCARGGVINEKHLCESLDKGHIAAAGLDVFESEPPPVDYYLFDRPDVILTPHTAGTSRQALNDMSRMTMQNILDHFDGALRPDCIFNGAALANR
ncbi:MAG: hydroxyacid dehydrogenase [Gammaproteobacteria bacterium]|nr:hydroxyacid dehydrogenase [Gammaproteobacteria bacterium]